MELSDGPSIRKRGGPCWRGSRPPFLLVLPPSFSPPARGLPTASTSDAKSIMGWDEDEMPMKQEAGMGVTD